jgi:hypothetical protein
MVRMMGHYFALLILPQYPIAVNLKVNNSMFPLPLVPRRSTYFSS